ncbi:MAG: SDR family oxidoreductase [Treponema sp.]|nr:SDR family oxidoreductase [Treponema sp.]
MENKSALVIGGSGGIGSGISRLFASKFSRVYVHGGHDSSKFDNLLEELRGKNPSCKVEKVLYDFYMHDFAELAESELSKIAESVDILCMCHGPFIQKRIDEMTVSDWQRIALYDYALPGFFVSKVLPSMMKNSFGRIILFGGTGTSCRTEFRTNAAYAGAKTAVGTLVESTAAFYAKFGITCNAILPGFVKTEYNSGFLVPAGMEVESRKIAECVGFLVDNPELNGVLLRVDKGWSPNF